MSETLAPAMLALLQNKTFGSHKIPEGWILVAAGNPSQYNKSVREFDIVTLDRVRKIEIEPDCRAWLSYARANHVHRAVTSYLEMKKQNFIWWKIQQTENFLLQPEAGKICPDFWTAMKNWDLKSEMK